jgi:hypothetical protein
MSFKHLDEFTLKHLADATRNAALIEEYRARNCVRRFEDFRGECDCWACQRYGLGAYYDFQLHQDSYPPANCLSDGVCWCWVCAMGRPGASHP